MCVSCQIPFTASLSFDFAESYWANLEYTFTNTFHFKFDNILNNIFWHCKCTYFPIMCDYFLKPCCVLKRDEKNKKLCAYLINTWYKIAIGYKLGVQLMWAIFSPIKQTFIEKRRPLTLTPNLIIKLVVSIVSSIQ